MATTRFGFLTAADSENARESKAELEYISGFGATLRRARDRFAGVKTLQPLDRMNASRQAVATTRDEIGKTIERTRRWGSAWDRATDKLVRAWFHIAAEDKG